LVAGVQGNEFPAAELFHESLAVDVEDADLAGLLLLLRILLFSGISDIL